MFQDERERVYAIRDDARRCGLPFPLSAASEDLLADIGCRIVTQDEFDRIPEPEPDENPEPQADEDPQTE